MEKLTDKQLRALQALGSPDSDRAYMFWAEARASWQGPRRTLQSLLDRGLAAYNDDPGHAGDRWTITVAGRIELAERKAW